MTYSYTNRLRKSLSLAQPHASGWEQSYGYDALKRLTAIASGAGAFSYLLGGAGVASSLPKRVLFPNSAYVTNTYDSVARLAGTVLKNSSHTNLNSHAYLLNAGNQRYQQTFIGTNYVDYAYDNIGQLVAALGKDFGGGNRFHEQAQYQYDAAGNLLVRTNYQLVQAFAVNALNQLSNVTSSGTLTVAGFTTTNASVTVNGGAASVYPDLTFSRSSMSLTNTAYTAVATDAAGRTDTHSIQVNLPATVGFQYDQNGNLAGDGLRSFDYDDENQLIRIRGTNWMSEFVYDALGRRRVAREYGNLQGPVTAAVTSVTPSSTIFNGSTWSGMRFTVGANALVVSELGRWKLSGNSGTHAVKIVDASHVDLLDGSVSVNLAGGTVGQFVYASLAKPIILAANTTYYLLCLESGEGYYAQDSAMTTTSAISINNGVYIDDLGSFYELGAGSRSYGPLSLRYQIVPSVSETRYIYDGMLPIQERDGNNIPVVTYTRGTDLSGSLQGAGGIGGLLARTDHREPDSTLAHAFYHSDGSGNVTMMINSRQLPVAKYHYDPFGNALAKSGPLADANTYRFSSKEIHGASGTYYYGYRFYDPNLQRWLNQDPLGEDGNINLYSFTGNSPVHAIDPFGLVVLDEDGFPVEGSYTGLGAYLYDRETKDEHDVTMCVAGQKIKAGAKEVGKEVAIILTTGAWGKLAKLLKPAGRLVSKLRGLLPFGRAANSAKVYLRSDTPVLAAIKDGKVYYDSNIMLSHEEWAKRALGIISKELPEGVWIGTVGKAGNKIIPLNSMTFFGNQGAPPEVVLKTIRNFFE